MGGTHHAIGQVIQSSGWLLDEITRYAATSRLSKDMDRTLKSFQKYVTLNSRYEGETSYIYHHCRELNKLQKVVTKISNRGPVARFLLHDADIEAIAACISSIKAVHDLIAVRSSSTPGLLANGVK